MSSMCGPDDRKVLLTGACQANGRNPMNPGPGKSLVRSRCPSSDIKYGAIDPFQWSAFKHVANMLVQESLTLDRQKRKKSEATPTRAMSFFSTYFPLLLAVLFYGL